MRCATLLVAALVCGARATTTERSGATRRFPDDFLFGVATASYQVEGGWDEDGKGESIWDHLLHNHPNWTTDGRNGDAACDSYHHYKEDVQLIKNMNLNFYRFSISWSRILPNGDLSVINQKGIDYYNNLIDELLTNDIEPMVTMYHWDLPYELQKLGGWANREIAQNFMDYAELLFETFGDRVKWWITMNEPQVFCGGYSGEMQQAPALDKHGVGDYMCGHTVLLAHAYAYNLYKNVYRPKQNGRVGIALYSDWAQSKSNSSVDIAAAEREFEFWLGWFAHPIFSAEGDYPLIMRGLISANSAHEGLKRSRLPTFSSEEVQLLRGSADFFGLSHYTTFYSQDGEKGPKPSRVRDVVTVYSYDSSWPSTGSDWLKVVPSGFRKLLKWIHIHYNKPTIFITGNGMPDKDGTVNDTERINYYKGYLAEMLNAIHEDGVKVIGYTVRSLMDSFEWERGYSEKFGLYSVNFSNPDRTRTAKMSSEFLAEIAKTHEIPETLT